MASHEISRVFSNEGTRHEVRMRVVDLFTREEPGTGTGDNASKYIYYVETLRDGNRIYLQRPANLHYGFDFLVRVENQNYAKPGERRRNYPKHDDFSADLARKKAENPELYGKLYDLLKKVYDCHDVEESELAGLEFNSGFAVDHILKAMKWLFIEQDIRYWNYSGRDKTWGIIPEK